MIDIKHFITHMQELTSLMCSENLALQNMQISSLEVSRERKEYLVSYLESVERKLTSNPALFNAVPAEYKSVVRSIYKELQIIMQQHAELMLRAKEVNVRVIEMFKQDIRKNISQGYDEAGNYASREMEIISINGSL
jgi:flagellar biosynthesis/type III secretory pathway chaperone